MSKGQSNIQGIYLFWRTYQNWSALRVSVRQPNKKQITISSKTYPLLNTINLFLEKNKIHNSNAMSNPEFKLLLDRLSQDIKNDYFLSYYKAMERVDLKSRQFDFEESLDEFRDYKNRHSIGHSYSNFMKRFWLPFFINKKNCQHPRDFIEHQTAAEFHLRNTKNKYGKHYSPAAYNNMTTPLNEYLRYLLKSRIIDEKHFFSLDADLTLEERKRRIRKPVRSTDTYTVSDLFEMKQQIDIIYAGSESLEHKLRAYGILLGSYCMGLRVGNVLGLPIKNLHPKDEVPHLQLKDNVVSGWSRGIRGQIRFENATKTSHDENLKLPFLIPSKDFCIELAEFLIQHKSLDSYLIECSVGVLSRWWKKICLDCGFKYIHPHGGKHGFATISAANLHLFNNNPYLLQYCCLHKDFRTTQRYINQKSNEVLKQFKK